MRTVDMVEHCCLRSLVVYGARVDGTHGDVSNFRRRVEFTHGGFFSVPNHVTRQHDNTTTHSKAQHTAKHSTQQSTTQHKAAPSSHTTQHCTHFQDTHMGNTAQHNTPHTRPTHCTPTPDPPSHTPTPQANTHTGNLLIAVTVLQTFSKLNRSCSAVFQNFELLIYAVTVFQMF